MHQPNDAEYIYSHKTVRNVAKYALKRVWVGDEGMVFSKYKKVSLIFNLIEIFA